MDLSSRDCFLRLHNKFDPKAFHVDPSKLVLKGRYTRPTKYGVALSRDVEYQPVPPELFIVEGEERSRVLAALPQELVDLEDPEVVLIRVPPHDGGMGMFAPHVDGFRVSCINFYLDSDGEVTTFYNYDSGRINPAAAFSAESGECWALNAVIPHSVSLSKTKARSVISVSFVETKFDRLVELLLSSGIGNVQETLSEN